MTETIDDVLIYLLTSVRLTLEEPKRYCTLYMFQAFRKLLEVRLTLKELPSDEIFEKFRVEVQRNHDLVTSSSMVGTKEYADFLDHLIELVAEG